MNVQNQLLPTGNINGNEEMAEVKTLAEVEKEHILFVLDLFKGSKVKTSEALGITLKTLYNKLHSYGLMGTSK